MIYLDGHCSPPEYYLEVDGESIGSHGLDILGLDILVVILVVAMGACCVIYSWDWASAVQIER